MDQLVDLVAQKTGLPPDRAQTAVVTVVNFIKDRLPPALSGQIDQVLAGESGQSAGLGGVAEKVGGMFGKKS